MACLAGGLPGAGRPHDRCMGATTSVPADRLTVIPGDEASTEITVRNTGRVVDAYRFEPLGPLAPGCVSSRRVSR